MDSESLLSDESQSLLNEDNASLLRRRTTTEVVRQYGEGVFYTATRALRESNTGWLLIFFPLGIIFALFEWNSLATLLFNIAAIIPLSALVSDSSDQLCDRIGELMGGLVNATFGNTVELIVGILALIRGEINVAQSMMMGSILSDILLVLGVCVVASTYGKEAIEFNRNAINVLCSLMTITVVVLVVPSVMYSTSSSSRSEDVNGQILSFSRGAAVILLFLYMLYLYFNLGSHAHLFLDKEDDLSISRTNSNLIEQVDENNGNGENDSDDDNDDDNEPSNLWIALIMLLSATAAIALCTHLSLDSLDSVASHTRVTKRFAAAILLPIASNAPELTSVIAKTREGRAGFAISVIVSSILQISLFVIPILAVLGWIIHQPMTLSFETFLTTLLFLAVLAVDRLLKDGMYTYLHGAMLIQLYAVMALTIYIYPDVHGKK